MKVKEQFLFHDNKFSCPFSMYYQKQLYQARMVNLWRGGLGVVQLHPAGKDGKTVAPSMSAGVLAFVDMQMC